MNVTTPVFPSRSHGARFSINTILEMLISGRFLFFFLFVCTFTHSCFTHAQRLEIGAGGGANLYKGDILPNMDPSYAKPAGQIFVRHNPGRAVSIKYALLAGSFAGSDEKKTTDPFAQARMRSFRTRLQEASVCVEYNFLDYRSNAKRMPFSPYLFGGVALFRFEPVENTKPAYNLSGISIPFGLGLKYAFYRNWNLNLEFGARKTFTDYLDDLSGTDINNQFQNGNPKDKDMYMYVGVAVSYTFYKIRCPEFY